jgi:glucokinase
MTTPAASPNAVSADTGAAIGIDIGGTRTKMARVTADGKVQRLLTLSTPVNSDPVAFLDEMRRQVAHLLRDGPALGIGLSLNGFLSDDLRSSRFSPNTPALVGIDFAAWLEGFGLPYGIEQDLNAPAVAEYYFGAYRGAPRLMAVSIGTGLGAGLIVEGRVLRFLGGTIGDTGHILLEPGGPACTAGCRGCAEALVSGPGMEHLAAERGAGRLPTREIIAAARLGEPWAVGILDTVGAWLGQWLASLAPIFLPSHVLLCGGVSEAGDPLLRAADRRLHALAGPEYARFVLDISRFGGSAGVIGAAAPFLLPQR